jgi:hypothetical protein
MDARVKPAHDENCVWYGPGSAAHHAAEEAARCAASGALRPNLQNLRDAAISAAFIARTGEICMTIVYSQIAPSRPKLMLDACLAL